MSDLPLHLIIKSQDRQDWSNTTPSKFSIQLDSRIIINKCTRMKLVSAELCNTFWNINNSNNSFIINSVIYTFPPGSYSLNDLLTAMGILLNTTYPSMTFAYNTLTSNITIANSSNFTLDLTNASSKFYQVLGFLPQLYSGANNYTGVFTPTIDSLYFTINFDIGAHVQSSNGYKSTFVIFNNVNKNNYIMFNDRTNYEHYTRIQDQLQNTINIELRDCNNNLLQGASEWVCMLAFN